MSVALIVATYLLARAEVEGLPTTSRFTAAISPENPRARVANAAQLKPFKEELAAWGLEEQVQITLELLVKAALLVRDEQGRLRPSALAYSWLQLPPATCHRLLFESSGVALPLPAKLIEALINGVALSEDSSVRYSLEVLAASGLIELEKQTLARAKPQSIPLLRLLGKVNFGRTGAEETTTALDLGAEWSKCYPGNSPASGWLKTEAGETLFSFTHSKSLGEKLTFDPWLLFRVLSVCHPLTSWQEFYSCQLSEGLVTLARRRKVTFEQVLSYLEAGIGQILSSEVSQNISQWYSKGTYFRARAVILLEAETQQALKQCRNDRRLRIYLESLISPRFAVVKAGELRRLQQMMGRRGLFLQVEENLLDAKVQGRGLILKLTRAQLQEIVVGLRYYREERSQQGYFTESLDEALNTVAQALSGREQREAQNLVARFERKEQVISQERQEEEAILEEKLYKQLEEALVTEAEVLIEYRTPGKEVQKRWVEPLELRKEGNYSYLTAYCHLRKEQRVFRLDRMRLLEKRLNG